MTNYLPLLRSALVAASLVFTYSVQAQNGSLAVNTDGSQADASALLDIKSTTQGVLVPRMNAAQRSLISAPATGLLVYQTDALTGFYFYSGSTWTLLGATGPQGAKGDRGETGATGGPGPQGATGPQGLVGPQGSAGAQGMKGDKGDTGAQGTAGSVGVTGPAGAAGSQGAQGPKGDKGETGAAGATGAVGASGPQGAQGLKGEKGETGPAGTAGPQGLVGPAGAAGATGPQGAPGQGVPAGGTAGQVLTKIDDTKYNTQWVTPASGGSGGRTSLQLAATLSAVVTLPVSSSLVLPDVIPFDNVATAPTLGNTWTGNNRFTVGPNGAGTYSITVQVTGDNATGAIPMIDINGTGNSGRSYYGVYYGNTQGLQNPHKFRGSVSAVTKMAAGDYFQIRAASATTVYGPTLNANGSTNISVVKLD